MAEPSVAFDAVVAQVRTLADGGIRVQLDLPESAIDAAAWLMQAKRNETPLSVACVRDETGADRSAERATKRNKSGTQPEAEASA